MKIQNPFAIQLERGKLYELSCEECSRVFTIRIDPMDSDGEVTHCPFCGDKSGGLKLEK